MTTAPTESDSRFNSLKTFSGYIAQIPGNDIGSPAAAHQDKKSLQIPGLRRVKGS